MSDFEGSMDECSRQVRRRKRRDRSRGRVFARVPCFRAERRFPRSLSFTRSRLPNINLILRRRNFCHLSMQTRPQSSSNCSGASLAAPCIMLDRGLRSNLPFIHSEGGAQSISILCPYRHDPPQTSCMEPSCQCCRSRCGARAASTSRPAIRFSQESGAQCGRASEDLRPGASFRCSWVLSGGV
jgi:hypothetical protein